LLSTAYFKASSSSHPSPTSEQAGGAQDAGRGTQPGQLAPADQRDIPDHMMSCSAIKSWGNKKKREDEGVFVVILFVFPNNHYA